MSINADAYRQAMRAAYTASNKLPMELDVLDQDNFLPLSAGAIAMCMSGVNYAEQQRGSTETVFSGYFRSDESNAVSMSGFTVDQMTTQIELSPIKTFHLYVRDLQNAISGLVTDSTYSDTMVDYFRRSFDYRWRLADTPAALRIKDSVEVPMWSGVATIDCLTRASGGQWPFTWQEISGMTSYVGIDIGGTNRSSGLDSFITAVGGRDVHGQIIEGTQTENINVGNDPVTNAGGYHQYGNMLAPIWALQSLIWVPPQTETFYTDQTTVTYATSFRSTGTVIDDWLDANTSARAFFQAGQYGKWMVVDGKWSSTSGSVTIDTSDYDDYPVSGLNITQATQGDTSSHPTGNTGVTGVITFNKQMSPTACWTQLALDNEGGTDINAGNNPVYSQSYDNGVMRFGPGSQLIVDGSLNTGSGSLGSGSSTSNDNLITFTSTNMNTASDASFNQVDDGWRAVSRSGYESTSSPIDMWAGEAAADGFTSHSDHLGSTVTSIKIGGDRSYVHTESEVHTSGDWVLDVPGRYTAGNMEANFVLGLWVYGFTTAYAASIISSIRDSVATWIPDLETSFSEVRITYPYILTTTDPEVGYIP